MIVSIYFYTTPGCFACNVMEKVLHATLENFYNVPFEKEIIELDDAGIQRAKELDIKDFPTTRFFNSEKNVKMRELKGTYSIDYVTKLLENLVTRP